jgi:hypothetical protein
MGIKGLEVKIEKISNSPTTPAAWLPTALLPAVSESLC